MMSGQHTRPEAAKARAWGEHAGAGLPPGDGPDPAPQALLQVRGVSKRFGGVIANRDLSLDVPAGSITGLIGPNGSGKTTLFNSIAGYHPVDAGSIRFAGREISRLRTAKIARLGVVRTFQQTHVYRAMDCVQNMQISTAQAGETLFTMLRRPTPAITGRAEALLEFVGLHAKRFLPAGQLSFGQQKLLEFAMALMNAPRLLLLDEPTAGINPVLINGLVDRLKRANAELGITLLVIEHNMRVIMNLASRIYCLAHGELLAQGAPETIRSDRRVIEAYLGDR
ncbi:MAG TPA: ABC transporter ATP-binding protein [Casimicrobiaceae bacterium]